MLSPGCMLKVTFCSSPEKFMASASAEVSNVCVTSAL